MVTADNLQTACLIMWQLVCAFLILFMQAGFAFLEIGSLFGKSAYNTCFRILTTTFLSAAVWWAIGYGIAGAGTAGDHGHHYFPEMTNNTAAWWIHSFSFAITAAMITSGAITERLSPYVFIWQGVMFVGVTYPLIAMAAWSTNGILYRAGYIDFAGTGVVHLSGGAAALIGCIIVGSRKARFGYTRNQNGEDIVVVHDGETVVGAETTRPLVGDGRGSSAGSSPGLGNNDNSNTDLRSRGGAGDHKNSYGTAIGNGSDQDNDVVQEMMFKPHDMTKACLGLFILWIGWFAFNASSIDTFDEKHLRASARAAANCLMSSAGAVFVRLVWDSMPRQGAPAFSRVTTMWNLCGCILGAEVAITANCAYVQPGWALLIGAISTPVTAWTSQLLKSYSIDDPLDCVAVHMGNGIWGLLATALFVSSSLTDDIIPNSHYSDGTGLIVNLIQNGEFSGQLLGAQVGGILLIFGISAALTFVWYAIAILVTDQRGAVFCSDSSAPLLASEHPNPACCMSPGMQRRLAAAREALCLSPADQARGFDQVLHCDDEIEEVPRRCVCDKHGNWA